MTWTNAFDVGECEVAVQYLASGDDTQLYRDVMAKGDSATFGGGAGPGPYTVAVSADGQVSLSGDQFGSVGGSLVLRVIPASIPIATPCRVSGIAVDLWASGNTSAVIAISNYADPESGIELSGSSPDSWAPDPCALPDAVEMSIYGEVLT